jgi:uncharacterized membrane protein
VCVWTAEKSKIWINFAHLFMVSLVPFTTAWVARTRLAAVPVFVYAGVFVLVELAYFQFEHHVLARAVADEVSHQTRRLAEIRSLIAFGLFLTAMLVSLRFPLCGFGLVCCAVLLYLRPELPGGRGEGADAMEGTGSSRAEPPPAQRKVPQGLKSLREKLTIAR